MTQAVNENIFRMLQFQKTRSSDLQIENVIFYGDLKILMILSQLQNKWISM